MSTPVIKVESLGKSYSLKGRPFWVLKDITLDVNQGDVLGIVGRNGAGKTTLLRILSRITDPTEGKATVYGRIGTLLETGTGFHEELSGRENIYMNGTILGMKLPEVRRKFDEIVEFSGVGKFIDMPIKNYSSGMRSRLAFSVAAHLDTEVLLIDEILAVGDIAFREKCMKKMNQLTQYRERTIVFVSHSMGAIQSLCNRAILIEQGKILEQGSTEKIIQTYRNLMLDPQGHSSLSGAKGRKGSGEVRLVRFRLEGQDGRGVSSVPAGGAVRLLFDYESQLDSPLSDVALTVVFIGSNGIRLFGAPSDVIRSNLATSERKGTFVCTIPRLPLLPGNYDIVVSCIVDRQLMDKLINSCHIAVSDSDYYGTGRLQQSNFGDGLIDYDWGVESISTDSTVDKSGEG
ncbi:ABC transporter ATP-binding protein [Nitrosomonadaceae bacterium]|nr:ABC transporter ATP-binding protein [Nitrosomonadaceae bacterium]